MGAGPSGASVGLAGVDDLVPELSGHRTESSWGPSLDPVGEK